MSADPAARTMAMPLTPLSSGVLPEVTASIRTALALAGDACLAIAVVLSVPLVILAIGIPIALALQFLVWVAGLM